MMFHVCFSLFSSLRTLVLFGCAATVLLSAATTTSAQRTKGSTATAAETQPGTQPGYQFRGVKIGMAADETRKKLGTPRDKSAEQDFYIFNDNEAIQIYYDKGGAVSAISIDFMNGATSVPTPKDVLGADADAKSDGSIHKVVRYPKAGYWVSYSRTAGNEPTITVIMQKIQ
jgi:hypothetical protein